MAFIGFHPASVGVLLRAPGAPGKLNSGEDGFSCLV